MANSRIAEFLATASIYSKIQISVEDQEELSKILNPKETYSFDAYCPKCKSKSVFYFSDYQTYWELKKEVRFMTPNIILRGYSNSFPQIVKTDQEKFKDLVNYNKLACIVAHCSRETKHEFFVFFTMDENSITKVGQYPNVNKFKYSNLSKYEELLGEYHIELKTALTLHSSGVGVGSFVYLRRVFEKIMFDNYKENSSNLDIPEDDFNTAHFTEKIEFLKDYLPKFMVDNKTIYSILSKGVHELDEQECIDYFDTLFDSIILILDEIIDKKEKEKKQRELSNNITRINEKFGGKKA